MKSLITRFAVLSAVLLLVGAGCFSLTDDNNARTTGPAGVFVSPDKGETWQQISSLPTNAGVESLANVSVYRFFDDPQDPKAIYWGSRGNGLYFSYDEGRTWQTARGELENGFVYAVTVDPDNKCLLYATTGFRVYRSNDCSRSWQEIHREDRSSARVSSLLVDPNGNHDLYMGKVNGDILRSTDNGDNWQVIARFTGTQVEAILADPVLEGTFYIATREDGLIRTPNRGTTWQELSASLEEYSGAIEYRRLFTHPTEASTLYWISTYGILKSIDGGTSWTPYSLITSPGSVDIFGFAVNAQNDDEMYYTTYNGGRSTFYKTEDGGATWSTDKLPSGQVPTVLRVHPDNGSIVYVGFVIPPN